MIDTAFRLEQIETQMGAMSERIDALQAASSLIVPISTFAPEPFEVAKTIMVVLEFTGDDYNASFVDANVNASGCNEAEAIDNLKENLLSRFAYLDAQPAEKLAKPLQKQIAILREFIRRKP